MADNETIADVIAWLRRPIEGENGYLTAWRNEIADRLEAAHKRERGNAAKLREALDESRRIASDLGGCRLNDYWKLNDIVRVCNAALSAPPRNCDLPKVVEDPWRAWLDDKSNWDEFGSPKLEIHDWLLCTATEQEGGDK